MKRKLFALLSIFLCIALCLGTFGFAAGTTEPQASDEPADNADPDAVSNGPEEVIYAALTPRATRRTPTPWWR